MGELQAPKRRHIALLGEVRHPPHEHVARSPDPEQREQHRRRRRRQAPELRRHRHPDRSQVRRREPGLPGRHEIRVDRERHRAHRQCRHGQLSPGLQRRQGGLPERAKVARRRQALLHPREPGLGLRANRPGHVAAVQVSGVLRGERGPAGQDAQAADRPVGGHRQGAQREVLQVRVPADLDRARRDVLGDLGHQAGPAEGDGRPADPAHARQDQQPDEIDDRQFPEVLGLAEGGQDGQVSRGDDQAGALRLLPLGQAVQQVHHAGQEGPAGEHQEELGRVHVFGELLREGAEGRGAHVDRAGHMQGFHQAAADEDRQAESGDREFLERKIVIIAFPFFFLLAVFFVRFFLQISLASCFDKFQVNEFENYFTFF